MWRQFGSPDPDGEFQWWDPPVDGQTSLNFARYHDADLAKALREGRATDDLEARKAAYRVVQERFADGVPYLFLEHTPWTIAARTTIHDLRNVTLPDGSPALPYVNGVHRLAETWMG